MSSPFPVTTSIPGRGIIELASLTERTSVLRTVTYQYPLKLISPSASIASDGVHVHTIYLLTYGGGLVAGDTIDVSMSIGSSSRLVMLTQGSTKIFKSPSEDVVSGQTMSVDIAVGAGLCYLPDPIQPFEQSRFEQVQAYNVAYCASTGKSPQTGSLCALDWVSEGRTARGEHWTFSKYSSKNEVWIRPSGSSENRGKLLLRDNMLLDPAGEVQDSFAPRMDRLGVFGTLILYGPLFADLGKFFMDEFKLLPRIGGRQWDSTDGEAAEKLEPLEEKRRARLAQETKDGVLWTASFLRHCTVVKFSAREVEGGKKWLRAMLEVQGSVVTHFGERALLCLR